MKKTRLFFSIIVPAHNEERYIENTLAHLQLLDYPKELYEVLVVENGSTDATLACARRYEGDNIHVFQSAKGSSRAKNAGIDYAEKKSDWFIFLDADTVLESPFLQELSDYLRQKGPSYSVGTVSLRPLPETLKGRLWFRFYDLGHRLTKTSYSIKIVRRKLFPPIRFDENLVMGEDLHVIAQALKHGKFFFMSTENVFTSTRRFEQLGWWYVFFYWTFVALLPESIQKRFAYEVVR